MSSSHWGSRRAAAGLLFVVVVALSGCRGGEPETPPTELTPARPSDRPLLASTSITIAERFRLGPAARAQAQLVRPGDLALDAEGNLYVLDVGGVPQLLKFGPDGRFVLFFGEEGREETKIGSALQFDLARWNTILLVDRGWNVLTTFLTIGFHGTSVQLTGTGIDVLALSKLHEFYLHKWVPEARRVQVLHMRAPLDSLHATYTVFVPAGRTIRQEARDVSLRMAVDSADRLYVAFQDGYPVRVLTPDGKTVRLIDLSREPLRKSPAAIAAEREENLARLREGMPGVADSLLREAAEPDSVASMIAELVVDPLNRLWVRTIRPGVEGVTPYDVFNEQGQYMARVDVPGDVRRTAFRPNGWLYVIDATSEASPAIVAYEVSFEGGSNSAGAVDDTLSP